MFKTVGFVSAIVIIAALILMFIEPSWRKWIMTAIVISPIPPIP